MSMSSGCTPNDWKTANVTPIHKKGTKGNPGNYRPVSLTSIPCKIMESIVKDRMMEHLLENNLIKDSQHGFMPGRATNLVEFMDFVTKEVDDGHPVDIFYLDFAKAFDKVPRMRLVKKMQAKGIDKDVVQWIDGTPTERPVTYRPVTKRPVTKCPFTKRPVTECPGYKTSRLPNVHFTKRPDYKTSRTQNVQFL
jgi:hypothetical protein